MNDIQLRSNYKYLEFLAKTGAKDIHPKKETATSFLIKRIGIREGQKVLEVGFGTGETLIRVASHFNVDLFGIELMPEMFQHAAKKLKTAGLDERVKLSLIQKNSDFPYKDNAFDIVYAESVLGFQDNPDLIYLMKEIFRVLKPSGKFALNDAVWKQGLNDRIVRKINTGCLRDFGMRQASDEYWTIDDWIGLYEQSGFKIISADLIEYMNENLTLSLPKGERGKNKLSGKVEKSIC